MRSPSLLISLIGMSHSALPQSMAKGDALVKDKTFPAPAAFRLRNAFQIFQNAALQVIDFGKAAREKIAGCLFAADAAGAEHRNFAMLCRIEMARGEILELTEALDAGIDSAFEGPHRHLKAIAGVDQKRIGRCDQVVPVGGVDIDADLPRRIGLRIAEGDDLLLQPDLQALERHC